MAGTISASGRAARPPGASAGMEAGEAVGPGVPGVASVREVCLIGGESKPGPWAPGDRVSWSGRAYRVEVTEDTREGSVYVHLGPLAEAG